MSKQTDGRNMLSNAILAIILILVGFGVVGAHLKIAELKEKNAEFEKKVNALNHEVETVQSQILILNNVVVDLHRKITKLEDEVAVLKKETKKRDKKHKAEIEKIHGEISTINREAEDLLAAFNGVFILSVQNAREIKRLDSVDEVLHDGIIDTARQASNSLEILKNKIESLENDLNKIKNKKICPLPPWRKK